MIHRALCRGGGALAAATLCLTLALPAAAQTGGPLNHNGLACSPLGQAEIALNRNGQLVVSNIGSSGQDGVRVDLGPDSQGAEFEWLPLDPAIVSGLRLDAYGDVGTGAPDYLGSTGMNRAPDSFFDIWVDLSPVQSQTTRMELYLDGQHVETIPGLSNVVARSPILPDGCNKGPSRVPRPVPLPWPPGTPTLPGPWNPIPCFIWTFPESTQLSIPNFGGVQADEIRLLTELPSLNLQTVNAMEVRFIVDSFFDVFTDIGECRYRSVHRGLGQAQLISQNGQLTVSNIGSSGEDGVSMDLGADEFGRGFEWLPLPPLPPGAFVEAQAHGTFQPGGPSERLGSLRVTTQANGQQLMTADYSPLGATQLQLQLYRDGQLVDIVSNLPATDPILIDGLDPPNGCGKVFPQPNVLCFFYQFPQPLPFIPRPGSPPIVADYVNVLAQNVDSFFDIIYRIEVRAADLNYDLDILSEGNALRNPSGQWSQAFSEGQANIRRETSAHGGGLTVSNIGSSGLDGVRITLPPGSDSFGMFFSPPGDPSTAPPGTGYSYDAIGRLTSDASSRSLGTVQLRTPTDGTGGVLVTPDYSPIGASGVRLQAFDDGSLVTDLSLPLGQPILRLPRWPDGCGKEPVPLPFPWPLCIWIDPGEDVPIEILGPGQARQQTITADSFRLLAENPDGELQAITHWGLRSNAYPFTVCAAAGSGIHVTTVDDNPPGATALHGAVPNPFNPRTRIAFDLTRYGEVQLAVYDLAGRHVKTLHSGPLAAGRQVFHWDGTDDGGRRVASGVYAVRLDSVDGEFHEKVTLLK